MIGKGAREIRPVTLAEVEKILDARQGTGGEFGFEQQTSLEYAKRFAHLKQSEAKEMVEELVKMEIKPEAAVKIVDILPKNKSQLMLILAKDKVELSEKKLSQVEELIAKFGKKAKKFEEKKPEVVSEPVAAETAAETVAPEAEKPAKEAKSEEKASKKKE